MTESPMHPSSGVGAEQVEHSSTDAGEEKLVDPQARERLDTDAEEEPSAPNREPETEFVRKDLNDDSSLDAASDNDDLDRPDGPGAS